MKIGIESSTLLVKNRTGVEHYTNNLLEALFKLDGVNQYDLVYMAFASRPQQSFFANIANVRHRRVSWLPGKLYNLLLRTPFAPPIDIIAGIKPDIFLFPNFVKWPTSRSKKTLVVVYDVSFIESSSTMVSRHRRYLSQAVPKSIANSSQVITISENAKSEIISHYQVDPQKISIIYPAVDHVIYKPQSQPAIMAAANKYKTTNNYILYTGTIEPRKNIVGILNAYADLPPALQQKYRLVLAGGKGWLDETIQSRLSELTHLNIITTGYVPDEDLPALYSGASLFVYPSLYEGFGMPPLEAMACGVPVITSDNSSLPEVVGDAGILVSAQDTTSLTKQIVKVLTDTKLAALMSKKGLKQAQKFSWTKSAQELVELFNKVGDPN